MSTLATTQREFMRALFAAQEPRSDGLAIYRASVAAGFAAALAATYPVVRRLVGDAFFHEAARLFARESVSASGDLGDYGAGFAAFLAAYPHAAGLPYLADVARLEWACHECERAPEPEPFDFAALARVTPEDYPRLRLVLHPGVRLLRSAFPVAAIHAANAPERDGVPAREAGGDRVVVHRTGHAASARSVDEPEWLFLQRLAQGHALEAASAGLAGDWLAAAPARYVAEGVVSGFVAPRCAP